MDMLQFVPEQLLILVGGLYVIGHFLKQTPNIKDYFIPWVLMVLGVAFSIALLGLNPTAVLQGVITSFVAVGTNQLVKQVQKKD